MKLTFLGGADEVGASSTLIEIAGKKILVDAGIRISPRTSRGIQNDQLPDLHPITASGGPDYILVTHAHTDHTAALPLVMEQYPHVPVLMTRPTEALVRVLQKDAQNIMTSRFEADGELPLFDEISVNRLLDAVQLVEFNQAVRLGEELQVTYHISGHIAGAAMLVLESGEGTLVMSGDVSVADQRTVRSATVPRIKADALVLESTYGGKLHANRLAEERRLIETLKRVTERGGKALIPAFALGRSQELVQIILAFRDQFDVPVYVDGMVRPVCDAYARFADLLPKKTVDAAGEDHLFFRKKVAPVRSAEQRMAIAMGTEPCVVISSSGMLTGGASVVYAKHFAPDERNAILLTGYQDEESPGRFLQTLMRDKERGEAPLLKMGNDSVKVRCDLDTYSLSAHADESELISIAEAFDPQEIMLVHGDEGPRHSLATGLRQRQRLVTTPRTGTERVFNFAPRPWAVGAKLQSGSHSGSVNIAQLWESLKNRAGDTFSARELAQVWWGDGERAAEMVARLGQPDNLHFAADWRSKSNFTVRSETQVARMELQRANMLRYPDIVGKLIMFRNSNDQPRLGVVTSADVGSFEAIAHNSKGTHFTGDTLLWDLGKWDGYGDKNAPTRTQLNELFKDARAQVDAVLPAIMRQKLVDAGQAIDPATLLPQSLPDGLLPQVALTAVVLGLALDGAVLEADGLRPRRARISGTLEQNEARDLALSLFPPEARLRKVGMEIHRNRLLLSFDFPQAAERQYADLIEELVDRSGWDVQVKPQVNQQALAIALEELLPDGVRLTKGLSYFMDKREVVAELDGLDSSRELEKKFLEVTDFKLTVQRRQQAQAIAIQAASIGGQLEINQTYAVLRQALEPLGMYKAGLKQGQIVLSFISPQLGERFTAQISELAQQTGYTLSVHPHPNQQKILEIVQRKIAAAGWQVLKGPSIFTDRAVVALTLVQRIDPVAAEKIQQEIVELTGYALELG